MVGRGVTFTGSAAQAIVVGEIPDEPLGFAGRDITERVLSLVDRTPVLVLASSEEAAGTGKTQIAAACARAAIAADRGLIAWVNAESAAEMHADLAAVADRLGLAGSGESAGESVRRYLESTAGPHLLVFDNLRDPAALEPYLPARGDARIVVTGTASFGETVVVGPFSRPESVEYLCRRAQLDDAEGADLLAGTLGDLPLALAATTAAIRLRRRYPEQRLNFQGCVEELDGGGLDAAVALAVDAALLDDIDGMLHRVLSSLAVLPPGGVSLPTLHRLAQGNDSGPESVEMAVDNCLRAALVGYSLDRNMVQMHRSVAAVLRNRLTGAGELDQTLTAAQALIEPDAAAGSAAAQAASVWLARTRLTLLEQTTAEQGDDGGPRHAAADQAREKLANAYLAAGQGDRAIELWHNLMAERARLHGDLTPRTMAAVHGLATAHHVAGDADSAISVYESALQAAQHGHGEDHPETLSRRQHLARALLSARRSALAIPLLQNIITDRERILGADHPDTVATREQLAAVHERTGEHADACTLLEPSAAALYGVGTPDRNAILAARHLAGEYVEAKRFGDALALYERLLADAEQQTSRTNQDPEDTATLLLVARQQIALCSFHTNQYERAVPALREAVSATRIAHGRHHPHTLDISYWLVRALIETGQRVEALVLLERCVEGNNRIRGPVHSSTVSTRHLLVDAYRRQPDGMDSAIAILEGLVTDHERILGPTASMTLTLQQRLVNTYLGQERHGEAIVLQARAVDGLERILGSENPRTHAARQRLARMYQRGQRYDDAIAVLDLDLADLARSRGLNHPDTLTARDELAKACRQGRRLPRAITLFEENLAGQVAALGATHADTFETRKTLTVIYTRAGRHAEATVHHEQIYGLREKTLGAEHPETLAAAHHLGQNYAKIGREGAAMALWERTLTRRERVLGAEHPETLHTRDHLGIAYLEQGRTEEAVAILEATLEARRRLHGPEHDLTLTTECNLAAAYNSDGRTNEAIGLQSHTLRMRESSVGPDHPETLTSQNNLAMALMNAHRHTDGISLAEGTLEARERVLGPDHPDTMISRNNLGVWYHTVGRYEQAAALLQQTLDDRTRVLGAEHPNTATTRRLLDGVMAAVRKHQKPTDRAW